MEIIGKVISILPPVNGKSQKGEWQKQEFIVETQSQYPKKICLTVWNKKIEIDPYLNTNVKVYIDVESKEYNGKWYTEVRAWKIEHSEQVNINEQINANGIKNSADFPWEKETDNDEINLPF